MTLIQLKYAVAVDTYRHFAAAAEHCFVTQPTLSMQISKMEKELDVLLFDRSKHPVEPTEIGKKVIAQARVVLREAGRIDEVIQSGKGVVAGDFRLGIIPTVSTALLPRFLKAVTDTYPEIRLKVEELQTDEIISRLDQDLLDAGIMATPLHDNRLTERPLYVEPFMAFVPDGHRLAGESFVLHSELQLNDILLLKSGHCFRDNVINLCRSAFPAKDSAEPFKFESGNFETMIKLAMQGFGMTLIPYLTALDLHDDLKRYLKPLEHPQPGREISMVCNKAQLKTGMIELISEIIEGKVPEKLRRAEDTKRISPLPHTPKTA